MSGFWAVTNTQGKAGVRFVFAPNPFKDGYTDYSDVVLNAGTAWEAVNICRQVNRGTISIAEVERCDFSRLDPY